MSLTEYLAHLNSRPDVKVTLPCSCGAVLPLEELYYCNSDGCRLLACNHCTTPVVDTYFCPTCLNSVFSTKAFEAKHKCRQCAVCPSCAQTLGVIAKDNDEHYLKCEYCKWSSDEVGLTGANAIALFDALLTHEEQSPVSVEFDRLLTLLGDKMAPKKPKKAFEDPYKPPQFQDVVAAVAKVEQAESKKKQALHILPQGAVANAVAVGQDSNNSLCTIQQRLAHPETISHSADKYWPARVDLSTKMGCRCPRCDKFLIKPKAGANRTTFDIHCIASALLPRVTVGELSLKKGVANKLLLYFKNPLEWPVELRFAQGDSKQQEGGPVIVALASPSEVVVPSKAISIAAYEETAEQAEGKPSTLDASDDPMVVGYRSLSKMGAFFDVTPRGGQTQLSLLVSLAVLPGPKGEPPLSSLTYQLLLDLGVCE
jgi:dynactin-4